jgi:hypothetical protein
MDIVRSIMVPAGSSDATQEQILVAIDLAYVLSARLTIIAEREMEMACGDWAEPAPTASGAGEADRLLPPEIRSALDRSVPSWRLIECAHGWRDLAGRADTGSLIVLPARAATDGTGGWIDIGEALIEHHLAVMTVPPGFESFDANGRALVLWDGSHTAFHALATAIPLLRAASAVTLLEIDDGSLKSRGCQVLDLLRARGVSARLEHVKAGGERAVFVALEEIAARTPAYAVLGGFGHARWIEGLVDGVTKRLIDASPVPLLLKH